MDETVHYEVTADDFIALNLYHARHSQAVRKKLMGIRIMASGFMLGLPLLVYRAASPSTVLPWQVYVMAVFSAGVFFTLYPWLAVFDMYRRTQKFLATGRHAKMLGRQTLHMGPDGLVVSSQTAQATTPWAEVEQIVVTGGHIFIYIGNSRAYVVPRRAFADQSAGQAFIQLAKQYYQATNQGKKDSGGG